MHCGPLSNRSRNRYTGRAESSGTAFGIPSAGDLMMLVLPIPIRVSLDVTSACNLSCIHCRHADSAPKSPDMTFEQIQQIIEDCSQMGIFRLILSGGEPFRRDDLIPILLIALPSRIGRIFVSTNGLMMDPAQLVSLQKYRHKLTFKISLDGSAAHHDRIRQKSGAAKHSQETIQQLIRSGFDVQITTTLMNDNLLDLHQLLSWAAKSGCSRHYLVEVIPIGRASHNMILNLEQRKQVKKIIQQAKSKYEHSRFSITAKLPFTNGDRPDFFCSGGREECGVLADGNIVGCRLMPDLVEANIRNTSISRLWKNPQSFSRFRYPPNEKLTPSCRLCEQLPSCQAGCHAYARAVTGRFYDPDPRCPKANNVRQKNLLIR